MLKLPFKSIVHIKNGFSLVELLIALLFGLALLTMVLNLYVTNLSAGTKSLKYSRLRSDLQSIVAMLETDIRRAGYGGDEYLVGLNGNKSIDINSSQDCIVYYYNHDKSASIDSANQMAFSFKEGAIKFKSGVGQVADTVCAVTNGWIDISDAQFVTITHFNLTEEITSNALVTVRSVKIELSGKLTSDDNYTYSITTRVQVRNIEY